MKKVLIASTALVAAGLMTTGASASEKIKLELGGYSKWWVVGAWQDGSYESATNNNTAGQGSANSVDIKGDNEIFFGGSTKLDNGMEVGISIELEAGGGTETSTAAGDIIDKSFVYLSGGFGKVILGSESNGTVLLHVMAPDAAANMGSDGILTGNKGIARPANLSSQVTTEIDTDAESEKITYVSPTFYGLTVGATYVPNVTEDNANVFASTNSGNTATNNGAAEIYGIGALYVNTFGNVGVKVSGGWVTYDVAATTGRSQEWSAGTQLSYAGFTVGGSYRDIQQNQAGNTNNLTIASATTDSSGYVWDAGIQYASGPYAVSAIYFKSVAEGTIGSAAGQGEDVVEVYQVSGKYSLGAGVDVLASVGHVEYDDETAKTATADANHNKGWAVMTGMSLAF
jgi:outer membrane protein OmpU